MKMLAKTLTALVGMAASGMIALAGDVKVGWLEIGGELHERPSELAWLMGSEENPTLRQVVDTIEEAGGSDKLSGLVIRLKDAQLTPTQVQEIGKAIRHARDAGKKVHVFGEGFDTSDFLLGSYADEVICQSGGAVSLPGMYMEEMFLADTLAWAGLKADFVQVGDYKGASEQMARNGPSKQWNQNIDQLLDSLYANVRTELKQGRRLDDAKLDAAMEALWMADAADAVKAGLIDKEVDMPLIVKHLANAYKGEIKIERESAGEAGELSADMANPFAMMGALSKSPSNKTKGPTIAVLHIDGAIVDGDSVGGFGGGGEVGSRTIRNALEDILADGNIKGMIVRIDSPGGSATASEVIWQGVRRVAAAKPVWTSVGGMAASGGYYIAVAGDKVYVNPSSIVGSIGVVGGKVSLQGLYEKFHVNVVGRGRGPKAAMFGSNTTWSAEDAASVRQKMTSTYGLFTKRVAAGRKGIDLDKTAEGRLFTGDKAIDLHMADVIGGLDDALNDMADKLNLDTFAVMDYPAPRPIGEVLQDMLKGLGGLPGLHAPISGEVFNAVKEVVGERVWRQLESPMKAMMQMREGKVMLVSPRVLIFK